MSVMVSCTVPPNTPESKSRSPPGTITERYETSSHFARHTRNRNGSKTRRVPEGLGQTVPSDRGPSTLHRKRPAGRPGRRSKSAVLQGQEQHRGSSEIGGGATFEPEATRSPLGVRLLGLGSMRTFPPQGLDAARGPVHHGQNHLPADGQVGRDEWDGDGLTEFRDVSGEGGFQVLEAAG
ncbi:hypothetical protein ACHAXS_001573, partial [Conticribra weissflogii]